MSSDTLWAENLWADNLWADGLWAGLDQEAPTGGWESWGGENTYNATRQRKKEREERLKRLRAEIRGLNKWR